MRVDTLRVVGNRIAHSHTILVALENFAGIEAVVVDFRIWTDHMRLFHYSFEPD